MTMLTGVITQPGLSRPITLTFPTLAEGQRQLDSALFVATTHPDTGETIRLTEPVMEVGQPGDESPSYEMYVSAQGYVRIRKVGAE